MVQTATKGNSVRSVNAEQSCSHTELSIINNKYYWFIYNFSHYSRSITLSYIFRALLQTKLTLLY